MKNIFLIIVCMLMAACASTQKSTQATETANVSENQSESTTDHTEKLMDTTSTDKGKITITEIEFYPPTVATDVRKNDTANTPVINVSGINLPNVGHIDNAAIKSIKQTTLERDSEKKGESRETSSTSTSRNEVVAANTEKTVTLNEAPAPDPYRWRYIFYILLLGAIAFLYLKRVPVLNWIKTILTGIKQLF